MTRCGVPTSTSSGRSRASRCPPMSPPPLTTEERNLAVWDRAWRARGGSQGGVSGAGRGGAGRGGWGTAGQRQALLAAPRAGDACRHAGNTPRAGPSQRAPLPAASVHPTPAAAPFSGHLCHPQDLVCELSGGSQHQRTRPPRPSRSAPQLLSLLQKLDCGRGGGGGRGASSSSSSSRG